MEFEQRPRIQLQFSSRTSPLVRVLKAKRTGIPPYVWPALFTALGGFWWGFDTGVMSQFENQFRSISATVQGLLVSSIIATAALSSTGIFAVGAVIACSAKALPQLFEFVGRCITGFGQGIFISSITVYVMENSPPSKRGRTMTILQLFNTLGIAADSFSWRFPLGLQAVVAIVLAIGTPFFPHSPHWLLSVNRSHEAAAGAQVVQLTLKQQAKELWTKDVPPSRPPPDLLWHISHGRACGIDAVLYYAPALFQQAGLSTTSASFLASGVSGIVMVVLTAGSLFFQDKWARRTQMIGGGSVIAGCMLTMGSLYASDAAQTAAGKRTLIALIYIFIAAFVASWAVVIRVIASEIQPKRTRAPATSLAQCFGWVIAFSTPLFLARSSSGPYFMFGGCALITVLICVFFQPETKGLSLDALDQDFQETKVQSAVKRYFGSKSASQSTGIELVGVAK
ncbi:hypothetical protein B0H17DRAFT_1197930 [Mycena rosella]|uniref:Major facilitator superfamily (MFS) profile domain-containing protein n=1 Tax=Mycena rosella TaxID=1033263 RepID=A0AAD7DPW3_MYCRO|nr:hypothetical protein B0H17DRAFT_1197930 [Mycena rosella]